MKQLHTRFTDTLLVNGKAKKIEIKISTEFDECFSIDDIDFENRQAKKLFLKQLENGQIWPCIISVEAKLGEITGVAYIGGCLSEGDDDINGAVRDYGMIAEAKNELERNIAETLKLLA